jgi:beta-lactam-binding protein with PASTA domain/predicted Ser/Thr protein kinase
MADVVAGTVIDGRYRVLSRLGSGGMADVFLAEDEQLGRKVALKLLHRRFSEDPGFVERFRREAQAAAGLQHPNIVSVYDRGAYDGTYYIAMEYLPGRSLKQLIRQEAPIDPLRAIEITIQILKAARFAHRHGVIHRDLKPHNVIIDDSGHVKVTDFGIARAGASDMTETGSIMGTAQYLSPEQAQGHAVSPTSDLYSVGVVLYELLTGRVPFDAEAAVTIALKHVSEAPTAPTQINATVPPELEHVVLWALNKSPTDRPDSADEFIRALEVAKESILAGSPSERTASMAAVGAAFGGGTAASTQHASVAVPVPPPPTYDGGQDDAAVVAAGPPPFYEPDQHDRRRRNPWPWIALVLVLLLLGGGAAAYFLTRAKEISVPGVVGDQLSTARTVLQNRGFIVNVIPQSSQQPPQTVIGEIPSGGSSAPKGSTVSLTVSSGLGTTTVPPVQGESLKQAKADIRGAHLRVGRVIFQPSNQYQQGQVTGSDPGAGSTPGVGTKVTLFVSSGAAKVTVPDVRGESEAQAKSDLHGAGFSVNAVQQTTSDKTQVGNVVSQSPVGNTQLAQGSTVTITIGQAPTTATVPRLRGMTADAATAQLQAAGFQVQQTTQAVTDQAKNGIVLHETPKAGTTAKLGSTVTIVVGQYNSTTTSTTPSTPTTSTSTTPPVP